MVCCTKASRMRHETDVPAGNPAGPQGGGHGRQLRRASMRSFPAGRRGLGVICAPHSAGGDQPWLADAPAGGFLGTVGLPGFPRIHWILTRIYVPTTSSDGREPEITTCKVDQDPLLRQTFEARAA